MADKNRLEEIEENYPNSTFQKADGLDDAVIAVDDEGILVYSKKKCVEVLVERDGMTEDEAKDFLDFNTYQAYVGPKTPIFTCAFD